MIGAYLFINLSSDENNEGILDSLKNIPEVIEAHRVYGTYDIILFIKADTTKELKEITLKSVRKLGSVHSTMTLLSLSAYEKSA